LTEVIDPGGGTDPPSCIAPLHIHDRDDEAWYVLEGALAFRVDQSEVEVPAGGGIVVPAEQCIRSGTHLRGRLAT
jgi:mannose-6-phosphate isomerase-like protein (cupin superfamily)